MRLTGAIPGGVLIFKNTIMEEQFVPHKQALILKSLGFNEDCMACYSAIDKAFIWSFHPSSEKSLKTVIFRQTFKPIKNDFGENTVTAPLWQQAFDWFRTTHNLHVYLNPFPSVNGIVYRSAIKDHLIQEQPSSYEESRLTALNSLITLLQIK